MQSPYEFLAQPVPARFTWRAQQEPLFNLATLCKPANPDSTLAIDQALCQDVVLERKTAACACGWRGVQPLAVLLITGAHESRRSLQFALRSLRELEGLVIFNSEAEELKYEKCKQHLSIAEAIGFGRYRVDVVLATPNVFLSLLKWGHVAVTSFCVHTN